MGHWLYFCLETTGSPFSFLCSDLGQNKRKYMTLLWFISLILKVNEFKLALLVGVICYIFKQLQNFSPVSRERNLDFPGIGTKNQQSGLKLLQQIRNDTKYKLIYFKIQEIPCRVKFRIRFFFKFRSRLEHTRTHREYGLPVRKQAFIKFLGKSCLNK